jgi:hypothetical protein
MMSCFVRIATDGGKHANDRELTVVLHALTFRQRAKTALVDLLVSRDGIDEPMVFAAIEHAPLLKTETVYRLGRLKGHGSNSPALFVVVVDVDLQSVTVR